jgi:hypothetical protein
MPVNVALRARHAPVSGLSAQQMKVARKIVAEGERRGVPRPVIKVALATALVEANLLNPNYGDATSLGAFQQQNSWGSPRQRTNVRYAAGKFYDQAVPLFHHGVRGGALAQAVQRSAFPGRYGPRLSEAGHILTKLEGRTQLAGNAVAPGGKQGGLAGQIPTSRQVQQMVAAPPPLHPLPQSVQPSYTQTRSPMAQAVLAGQKGASTSQLQATTTHNQGTPFQSRTQTVTEPIPASVRQALQAQLKGAARKQREKVAPDQPTSDGRVRIAPGADRAGVPISKSVVNFVREISGLAGRPLTITTGSNHSRMTTSGNVSDHWSGHAADIAMSGRLLTHMGQIALIAAGAGRKWAKRQTGGLFNINGHQIIFNTMEGGNHFNHLHVSAY